MRLHIMCGLIVLAACSGSGDDQPQAIAAVAVAVDDTKLAQAEAARRAASVPRPTSTARDPGARSSPGGAGVPLGGLNTHELAAFSAGRLDFSEVETVPEGLGPTMNLDSCAGCHMQPAIGGSSPGVNPQIAFASALGASNRVPSFLSVNGPVREARFVRNADNSPDGGVHALFTVAGRSDAVGCRVAQPDFERAVAQRNVVFRIPTPLFGAGLIEQIPDANILANMTRNGAAKRELGIRGRGNVVLAFQAISAQPNKNGNDGTLGRFGWKAQNKSLLLFSGEAYNVEMGISSELFPTERDETEACQGTTVPNSLATLDAPTPIEALSSIEKFAFFMRFLAPPLPSADAPGGAASVNNGKALFASVGCALCHTPALRTGNASVAALRAQEVNLYSDLLLHDMGEGLADGISQGQAGPGEFRTAPLWGLGQRLFFLHDGRTSDLAAVLQAHQSTGSEANGVIALYSRLADREQQDLLNFLRSL